MTHTPLNTSTAFNKAASDHSPASGFPQLSMTTTNCEKKLVEFRSPPHNSSAQYHARLHRLNQPDQQGITLQESLLSLLCQDQCMTQHLSVNGRKSVLSSGIGFLLPQDLRESLTSFEDWRDHPFTSPVLIQPTSIAHSYSYSYGSFAISSEMTITSQDVFAFDDSGELRLLDNGKMEKMLLDLHSIQTPYIVHLDLKEIHDPQLIKELFEKLKKSNAKKLISQIKSIRLSEAVKAVENHPIDWHQLALNWALPMSFLVNSGLLSPDAIRDDNFSTTPFGWALHNGDLHDAMDYIITKKIPSDYRPGDFLTSLFDSQWYHNNHVPLLKLLLANFSRHQLLPSNLEELYTKALDSIAANQCYEILPLLEMIGLKPVTQDQLRRRLLIAVRSGNRDLVESYWDELLPLGYTEEVSYLEAIMSTSNQELRDWLINRFSKEGTLAHLLPTGEVSPAKLKSIFQNGYYQAFMSWSSQHLNTLIEHGMPVDILLESYPKISPLTLATFLGDAQLVKVLLTLGASPNPIPDELSILVYTLLNPVQPENLDELLVDIYSSEHHKLPSIEAHEALARATSYTSWYQYYLTTFSLCRWENLSKENDVPKWSRIKLLLDMGLNINEEFINQIDSNESITWTPLKVAAALGLRDEVESLLNRGAHLGSEPLIRRKGLHNYQFCADDEIRELLIKRLHPHFYKMRKDIAPSIDQLTESAKTLSREYLPSTVAGVANAYHSAASVTAKTALEYLAPSSLLDRLSSLLGSPDGR